MGKKIPGRCQVIQSSLSMKSNMNFGKNYISLLLFLLTLTPTGLVAQGVAVYTPTRETGITFNSIDATGIAVTAWRAGENTGNNRSYPIPIGFSFNYLGKLYTHLSVSTNGFVDFSSNTAAGYQQRPYGSDNTAFSVPPPDGTLLALAPFYDDLMITWGFTLNNAVKYETTGTADNHVFTLEWVHFSFEGINADHVNFQIRLHEADATIEFIYGTMLASGSSQSYTCGINDSLMSVPPIASQLLTQQSANSATFGSTPNNTLSVIPASNSKIVLTGCILPGPAGAITGTAAVCQSSTGLNYSVPSIVGATSYVWSLPSGFTITSGANTNAITVSAGATAQAGNITVYGSNSCGDGTGSTFPVTVSPRPVPTITGPASSCAGIAGKIYTTQAGMTNYQWNVTSGGTITSGSGTNAITVTWNTAGTDTVKVNYANAGGCSAAAPVNFPVTVNPNPQPTITGPASVCAGTPGNVYTTQAGMTNYQWSVSAGGTITAGGTGTSNSVTVKWNTAGAQSVSVNFTNSNGCTSQTATQFPVTVNPIPVPTLSGSATGCVNTTPYTYTTEAGMVNYVWNVTAGGMITGGGTSTSNSVTVVWNATGAQTVSISYTTPTGCIPAAPVIKTVTVNQRPSPTLSGPFTACAGSTGNVYTTQPGMSNYTWSVTGGIITAGGTPTSSTATINWTSAGQQTVGVNYNNSVGCPALNPTLYTVTVNPQPTPGLSGPNAVCAGTTGNIYTTDPGMTGYSWSVSPGGTITAGGTPTSNTVTVKWNIGGNQHVQVNYNNSFGCPAGSATLYPVTVYPRPVPVISGPTAACAATSGHIYTTDPYMNLYVWAVSPGGTINSGGGSDTISITWNTAGQRSVSLSYVNQIGCTTATPTVYPVTVSANASPAITGPAAACTGTSGHVYATAAGMTNYQWTISPGGIITSGTTSNTVTVTWIVAGTQNISVSYSNPSGCTSTTPGSKTVTVTPPPTPSILGNTTPCANSGNYSYSTEPGMTGYQWTLSSGGLITAGAATNQVNVTWYGSGAQWIGVNYNSAGCTAATPSTLNLTVKTLPGSAGAITGANSVCAGISGVVYSVDSVAGATSYLWNLPPGATIAAGSGTRFITVDFGPTAQSGNISVSGYNACGSGPLSPPLAVTVTNLPAAAGPILGLDSVAYGAAGIHYEVAAIAGALTYSWSFPAGASIVAGANTRSVTVNFSASSVSGNISVKGVNGCGTGISSPTFALIITAPPEKPHITQSFDLLFSNHPIGNQWYLDGSAIQGATGPVHQALTDGWYWTEVTRYGVTDTSNHLYVIVTGIAEQVNNPLTLFPVPNDGKFTIKGGWNKSESVVIEVINAIGSVIFRADENIPAGAIERHVVLPGLPAGLYTAVIRGSEKQVIKHFVVCR